MKTHLTFYIICFFLILLLASANDKNTNTGTLEVQIKALESNQGSVMIAVYNNDKEYMKIEKSYLKKKISILNQESKLSITNLPFGKYAIVCFHDKNNNNKLDKNTFGIPKEGYGFSNDAKGSFGPPNFEKSSFNINKATYKITINMTYW
jgi:uncharacterized protein (DUF2141 family)